MGYQSNFFGSTFGLIVIVFGFVLLILWTLLPFAIFGIKGKLDQIISGNKEIRDQLARLNANASSTSAENPTPTIDESDIVKSPPVPGVQLCPECGQKNSLNNLVCTHCGAELRKEPSI
jgi:hypothetical protein